MNRIALLPAALLALVCFGAQPAAAGCPPNTVCVTVPAGNTAADVAELIQSNWDISPDFTCNSSTTEAGGVKIIADTGERIIVYEVPAGTVQSAFTYNLRFSLPLGGTGQSPFDIFVNYDDSGEVLIRDGLTAFPEINMIVSTTQPGQTAVPAIGWTRAALLVAGLLAAGVAIILVRRF